MPTKLPGVKLDTLSHFLCYFRVAVRLWVGRAFHGLILTSLGENFCQFFSVIGPYGFSLKTRHQGIGPYGCPLKFIWTNGSQISLKVPYRYRCRVLFSESLLSHFNCFLGLRVCSWCPHSQTLAISQTRKTNIPSLPIFLQNTSFTKIIFREN